MKAVPCHSTQSEWDNAISGAGGLHQQSWAYGAASDCQARRWELWARGQVRGWVQTLHRHRFGIPFTFIPCGPVWKGKPEPWAPNEVVRGVGLLIGQGNHGLPLMTPAHVAVLDISDKDRLWTGMHQKWRNRLRSAQSNRLDQCRSTCLDQVLESEARNRRILKYRSLPLEFIRALCEKGRYQVFHAQNDGQIVASALFYFFGCQASYLIGWSNEIGRSTNAMNLVIWDAIGWLSENGINSLDLGQLDTVNAPGLARFKLGTGARPVGLGATHLFLPTRLSNSHFP